MKAMTILLSLVLMNAHADEPYPEAADVADWPHNAHWQLTMVNRTDMVDITAPGFRFISRMSCIKDGIRRIESENEKLADVDFIPEGDRWLGFVCEYVEQ